MLSGSSEATLYVELEFRLAFFLKPIEIHSGTKTLKYFLMSFNFISSFSLEE